MSDRGRLLRRAAPALLVGALAVASQLPTPAWLELATPDPRAADAMTAALDGLPDQPSVLIGFDPDLGTYAEVRPTVRVLIAELVARDARLAFVSLTAEGRAIATAELARLARAATGAAAVEDLGFVAGAEAGLVDIAPTVTEGIDAIVVVGGNDLGPRSWIEQVLPRVDDLPMLAVTPAVLLPEVQPYVVSGQLDAGLLTPREGAAFRASAAASADAADGPQTLSILVGMLAGVVVLGQALAGRVAGAARADRTRDA
jgi:hypothetical protein